MDEHQDKYHYKLIRRAITEIDAAPTEALSLQDLSARIGVSPSHFQRIFSRWAGVSAKNYQQFLQLGHAKSLLQNRFSTLATSHASGLSGGGRLHDLFLKWEAMTPGDYAKGGADLDIRWACFDSPFGPALVMGTDKGICGLAFYDEIGKDAAKSDLMGRWPKAQFIEDAGFLAAWVEQAFAQKDLTPLHLIGAPFQIKVWEALLRIPSGHVTTYSQIAQEIGSHNAVRAVGTAVGRNPIGLFIPCHRVVRKSGELAGYHWGLPLKRAILARETCQIETSNMS